MSFMTLKNVWAKALAKNFQKFFFMDFVCFSNLRARFSAFFLRFFFYSFLSAVITKEILIAVTYGHAFFTDTTN